MPRPRTIDRDRLLRTAETIISDLGLGALSLGAVAQAAGVPKASVQSAFKTRDALVGAVLDRWIAQEGNRFAAAGGTSGRPSDRILAHIESNSAPDRPVRGAANLIAALLDSPSHRQVLLSWYSARMDGLVRTGPSGGLERVALLAAEGAYLLRVLGLVEFDQEAWRSIFSEIRTAALREDDSAPPRS